MTAVRAPLMSLAANGTLADVLTFARRGSKSIHLSLKPSPKTTYTRPQLARRRFLNALNQMWNRLPYLHRNSWAATAHELDLPLYHAYLAVNQARWNQNLWPMTTTDDPISGDIPVIGATFAAGARRLSARPGWVSGQKPIWTAAMWSPPAVNPDQPNRITQWTAMYPSLLKWCHETRVAPGTYRYYVLVIDCFGRASLSKNGYPLVVTD